MVSFNSALSFVLLAGTSSISSAFTVHPQHGLATAFGTTTSATSLYMGWGPDPIWTASEIESLQIGNMSKDSSKVTVTVSPETAAEFKIPGQYVQVRPNEDTKPLFLAISSPPDAENASFEFLIKKTDDNTWISDRESLASGIEVSQVLGGGFPMKEELESLKYDFPCQNVLLFAAGSGIAPIRSAIESGELQTTGARTARLYYGVRTENDLCFVDQFPAWEKAGVEVVPVLSQPSESWKGRTGYVQNALEEDGVPVPRNTGALMCGMKGMAEAVTDVLTKSGVFEGRILTNF
jgi:NAD(P)H-flavin reductase